ncbi:MAG: hypothetical protein COV72_00310 [Candidatus Omnitrophica bacterium CG11_big_fil_rev_8_21_14_0_20_42_13]|uniref:MgtC/SapB/SrpB/YhiD N-terminal domain-containing protein n=1 Tax=Candidatus Ghiorseimicrobium undicola TaxID=1974746 RepID=A0A2H0LZY8_9BACT|nr:MAG: hypothetical protein COV72_00310 [Candidatus Omnitrophica bacterium CG11_big_fil_rev_8_21_14_0_20_42_13]
MLSTYDVIIRLVLSALLGGLVGIEREVHKREAGLRTHILVSLGSTLIMLTSMHIFDIYNYAGGIDPSRIAAGVVTGIGFIGAGTIIRNREAIKGLTTAASIWTVSAIGLAVGCGFISAACTATILVLLVLLALRNIERVIRKQ